MNRPQAAAFTAGLGNPVIRTFRVALGRPGLMSFGAGFMNPAGSLRLSISNHTPETIAEGLSRLARAIATAPVGAM
jgi:DNA-binding transcriptional MocR family regulator